MKLLDNRNQSAEFKGYSYYMGEPSDVGNTYNWVVILNPEADKCDSQFFSTKKAATRFVLENK